MLLFWEGRSRLFRAYLVSLRRQYRHWSKQSHTEHLEEELFWTYGRGARVIFFLHTEMELWFGARVSDSDDGGCRAGTTLRLSLERLAHASPSPTKLCSTLCCTVARVFFLSLHLQHELPRKTSPRSQVRVASLSYHYSAPRPLQRYPK
jgi:hypothetical protein